jgi:hypothetical protein
MIMEAAKFDAIDIVLQTWHAEDRAFQDAFTWFLRMVMWGTLHMHPKELLPSRVAVQSPRRAGVELNGPHSLFSIPKYSSKNQVRTRRADARTGLPCTYRPSFPLLLLLLLLLLLDLLAGSTVRRHHLLHPRLLHDIHSLLPLTYPAFCSVPAYAVVAAASALRSHNQLFLALKYPIAQPIRMSITTKNGFSAAMLYR